MKREEAEELALGMCSGCDGDIGCHYKDNRNDCDGYLKEVEDILKDEAEVEKLRDCPFCGGKAEWQRVGATQDRYCIKCLRCWAKSVYVAEYEKENAIYRWNTRTSDKLLAEVLEALQEAKNTLFCYSLDELLIYDKMRVLLAKIKEINRIKGGV